MIRPSATRILDAPRYGPDEATLGPAIDALGGEVVRLRSRDGVRLHARWLPAERGTDWSPDPYEAILLLHGWTGSVAPDLVELGPSLRRTAGVLGLDFGGHGGSDDAPTTFGVREVDDVAAALDWLGDRGIRRVALVGSSMGGVVAIAAVVSLGDGTLVAADHDPSGPATSTAAPRPLLVAIVAESVAADLRVPIANRIRLPLGGPLRRMLAGRLFAAASRELGGDIRAMEPGRVVALVEPVPLLLIHGDADTTVRPSEGQHLVERAGPSAEHWVVPGAGHGTAHRTAPAEWDDRVARFLRRAFFDAREAVPIIAAPVDWAGAPGARGQEGD